MEGEERIQGKSETSSLPSSKWAFALEQSGTSPQLTSQFRGPSQVPESQARSQGEKTVFPIYREQSKGRTHMPLMGEKGQGSLPAYGTLHVGRHPLG